MITLATLILFEGVHIPAKRTVTAQHIQVNCRLLYKVVTQVAPFPPKEGTLFITMIGCHATKLMGNRAKRQGKYISDKIETGRAFMPCDLHLVC